MRKIGKWEYPYKAWPDDFPHRDIFSKENIDALIENHGLPNSQDFRKVFLQALQTAARYYYANEYFKGATAPSDKEIRNEAAKVAYYTKGLREKLQALPLELFEEFVEATEARQDTSPDVLPYQNEDISHYRQCRINEQLNVPIPPIEAFYRDHKGFDKFNALKARLLADLTELEAIVGCNYREDEWLFERKKSKGAQRHAINVFARQMALFWEHYAGKKATRNKADDPKQPTISACLDFLVDVFDVLAKNREDLDNKKQKMLINLSRTHLDTALTTYIKDENARRKRCGDTYKNEHLSMLINELNLLSLIR